MLLPPTACKDRDEKITLALIKKWVYNLIQCKMYMNMYEYTKLLN